MRIVSPILKRVVYPSLGRVGYLRRWRPSFLSVVTYHGVLPEAYQAQDQFLDGNLVSADNLRAQLRLLKSDYDLISCSQFVSWLDGEEELPPRAVLVTCDDGLLNNLTDMLPILREHNVDCLFFVTGESAVARQSMLWYVELYLMLADSKRPLVNFVSQGIEVQESLVDATTRCLAWARLLKKLSRLTIEVRRAFLDEASSEFGLEHDWKQRYLEDALLRRRFALLKKVELKQLCDAGMTIGAHSISHPILTEQPPELAREEIAGSATLLRGIGFSPWAFAYPFGDTSAAGEREFSFAREAGFRCAFINVGGNVAANSSLYALPRVHANGDMNLREFEAHITGFHSELRARLA